MIRTVEVTTENYMHGRGPNGIIMVFLERPHLYRAIWRDTLLPQSWREYEVAKKDLIDMEMRFRSNQRGFSGAIKKKPRRNNHGYH